MGLGVILDICPCEYNCAWTGNTLGDAVECSGEAVSLRVERNGSARYGARGTVFAIK